MRGVRPAARSPRGAVPCSRKGAAGSAPALPRRRPRAGLPRVGPCLRALPAAVDAARARCCRTGTRAGPRAGTPRRRSSLGECRAAALGARAGLARRSRWGRRGRPACGVAPAPGTRGWGTEGTTFRPCEDVGTVSPAPVFLERGRCGPGRSLGGPLFAKDGFEEALGCPRRVPRSFLTRANRRLSAEEFLSHAGRRRPCERVRACAGRRTPGIAGEAPPPGSVRLLRGELQPRARADARGPARGGQGRGRCHFKNGKSALLR